MDKDDSDNESFCEEERGDSDFEEEFEKKPKKVHGHHQPSSSSSRPGIKPRTSVTGTLVFLFCFVFCDA